MPIQRKEQLVKPEKVYPNLWVQQIRIVADLKTQNAIATYELLPYNDAGESSKENIESHDIIDIMGKIKANPKGSIARAYHALLAAVTEDYEQSGDLKK